MLTPIPQQSPPLSAQMQARTRHRRLGGWMWIGTALLLISAVATWMKNSWKRLPAPPSPAPPRFPRTTAAMRPAGRLRVLLLGNSLTEYNGGLALVMQRLTESAEMDPLPIFDEVTKYGATWSSLWDLTRAREMIDQGHWDDVVLQDFSSAPLIYRSEMDVYGQRFSDEIRGNGAEPVFFMTWPHNDQLNYQSIIANAYGSVAAANHGLLAPVGNAWLRVLRQRPSLTLYDPRDVPKKHPTPAGSYLSACVFYSLFFHQSPRGLTAHIFEGTKRYIDLSAGTAEYLQETAWATVCDESHK